MIELSYNNLPDKNIADILIITATAPESAALHERMDGLGPKGLLCIKSDNNVYYGGRLGGYNVIHCQCGSMGTQEKYSSILTTHTALEDWKNIKCVIMIGIAFGMYDDDEVNPQHFSDVLVSEKIKPYENQRVNKDGSITYKGCVHYPSNELLSAFAEEGKNWEWTNGIDGKKCKALVAPLLSGEKLVDNLEFRNRLRSDFPEYKGGEMEGIGVAAVCDRHHLPWILTKAICDFGDGNKGEDKDSDRKKEKEAKQRDAAMAAVDLCVSVLQHQDLVKLFGRRNEFFYRPVEIDLNKVFFISYDPEHEPYYLNRRVDDEVSPYIRSMNCWIFGESGMGKSNLLYRAMARHSIRYINVDCGLAADSDEREVFVMIYEKVCEVCEVECAEVYTSSLRSIINRLESTLTTHFKNSIIYILLDEIPFDFDSEIFKRFVNNLCIVIAKLEKIRKQTEVYFMLSSISSPKKAFSHLPKLQKYKQYIKFFEIGSWTEEECCMLIDMLSQAANIKWGDISIAEFAKRLNYSPREIKNCMKEICALNKLTVTQELVDRILL